MMQAKLTYTLAFQIHKGMVREGNEDDLLINPDLAQDSWTWTNEPAEIQPGGLGALFVVADGMGGLNAGEVASRLAVESMKEVFEDLRAGWKEDTLFNPKDILLNGIRAAAKRIAHYPKEDPAAEGLGTTLTVGWLLESKLHLAWVGDSRAYALHPDGTLEQLNKDHSYVQELVDKGELTEEQAFYHPQKNIITRCLSDGESKNYPDYRLYDLQPGDRLLFCSDGLNTMIDNPGIQRILQEESTTLGCAKKLVDEANAAGGHDNITVILADIVNADGRVVKAISQKGRKFKLIYVLFPLFLLMGGVAIGYFYANKEHAARQKIDKPKSKKAIVKVDSITQLSTHDSISTDATEPKIEKVDGKKSSKGKTKQNTAETTQNQNNAQSNLIPENEDLEFDQESKVLSNVSDSIYYVIVYSPLTTENEAEEEMKKQIYSGARLEVVKDIVTGTFKISAGKFNNRRDAENEKEKWIGKIKKKPWIYVIKTE